MSQVGFVTLTGRTRKDPCQLFFKPPHASQGGVTV